MQNKLKGYYWNTRESCIVYLNGWLYTEDGTTPDRWESRKLSKQHGLLWSYSHGKDLVAPTRAQLREYAQQLRAHYDRRIRQRDDELRELRKVKRGSLAHLKQLIENKNVKKSEQPDDAMVD